MNEISVLACCVRGSEGVKMFLPPSDFCEAAVLNNVGV